MKKNRRSRDQGKHKSPLSKGGFFLKKKKIGKYIATSQTRRHNSIERVLYSFDNFGNTAETVVVTCSLSRKYGFKEKKRKTKQTHRTPFYIFFCLKMMRSTIRGKTRTSPLAARDLCIHRCGNSFYFILEKGNKAIVVTIQDRGRHMVDARPCFEEDEENKKRKRQHRKADSYTYLTPADSAFFGPCAHGL